MTAKTKSAMLTTLRKRQARITAQIKAIEDDEEEMEDDPENAAEGDEEDVTTEGDPEDPEAEGDEEDPEAEGDPEDPEAEGDEEDPEAEDEEEQTQMRIAAFRSLPEAKGRRAQADELAKAGVKMSVAKRILRAGARADRLDARTDAPLRRSSSGGNKGASQTALKAAIDKVNAKGKPKR